MTKRRVRITKAMAMATRLVSKQRQQGWKAKGDGKGRKGNCNGNKDVDGVEESNGKGDKMDNGMEEGDGKGGKSDGDGDKGGG